jgi:hypothetical protein
MALTQADLDRIDTALASGELEIEQDGKRVRYASASDLLSRRAFVASAIAGGTASSPRPTGSFRFDFTTYRGD